MVANTLSKKLIQILQDISKHFQDTRIKFQYVEKQAVNRVFCFSERDLSPTGYFLIHQLCPNNITPALKGLHTLVLSLTAIKGQYFLGF